MDLIVKKFGGTSVENPQKILHVASLIAQDFKSGLALVVVVSAMGDTTDHLVALAHEITDHPQEREMDMLLTAGERIAMALLSMALATHGIQAISLTGSQSGIITDHYHGRARIKKIVGHRIQDSLRQGAVVIVAGFQGVSLQKEVTTLGRGGSDTSAVALAVALGAQRCEIYTDVNGVYTADPRFVPHAKSLRFISAAEMIALAYAGGEVLHPRSATLSAHYRMPTWIKNTFTSHEGTKMVFEEDMEFQGVRSVSLDASKLYLEVLFYEPYQSVMLWSDAGRENLGCYYIAAQGLQAQCFIDRTQELYWVALLQKLQAQQAIKSFTLEASIGTVALIGMRLMENGSIIAQAWKISTAQGVPWKCYHTSSYAIILGVPVVSQKALVQALHTHFCERESA